LTTAHGLKRAAAGNAGGITLSFVASANSASNTITIPASAQAGDVAILFDFAVRGQATEPTDVVPTGWTGIITHTFSVAGPTSGRARISYKILAGGDPGASVTGMNSDVEDKVMLVFRGSQAISAVNAAGWDLVTGTGNPSSQTVAASGGAAPLVVFGMADVNNGTAAFSTASPAFDATVANSDADMLAGYKIYNSAPADHTIDHNHTGSNALGSGYLELS
jgi:hypothetical protein